MHFGLAPEESAELNPTGSAASSGRPCYYPSVCITRAFLPARRFYDPTSSKVTLTLRLKGNAGTSACTAEPPPRTESRLNSGAKKRQAPRFHSSAFPSHVIPLGFRFSLALKS